MPLLSLAFGLCCEFWSRVLLTYLPIPTTVHKQKVCLPAKWEIRFHLYGGCPIVINANCYRGIESSDKQIYIFAFVWINWLLCWDIVSVCLSSSWGHSIVKLKWKKIQGINNNKKWNAYCKLHLSLRFILLLFNTVSREFRSQFFFQFFVLLSNKY